MEAAVPKIKICGLTSVEDARILNQYPVDFAGMVVFFKKSRRNVSLEKAKEIMNELNTSIKKVAVMVSPTKGQILDVQKLEFDYLQIHGELADEVLKAASLPIIRAVNVESEERLKGISELFQNEKVKYVAFDGRKPGNGETFDWDLIQKYVDNPEKIMLAGGLNRNNVVKAIRQVHPAIVDISTGVENSTGFGKNDKKVKQFVETIIHK